MPKKNIEEKRVKKINCGFEKLISEWQKTISGASERQGGSERSEGAGEEEIAVEKEVRIC